MFFGLLIVFTRLKECIPGKNVLVDGDYFLYKEDDDIIELAYTFLSDQVDYSTEYYDAQRFFILREVKIASNEKNMILL